MSDLIQRRAMIDKMRQHRALFCKNRIEFMALSKDEKARVDEIDNCIADLINAPSTEPERKKGKWLDEKINSYTSRTYCSECGSSASFVYKSDDYYGNHAYGETVKTNFCPNCGADMRSI